MNGERSGWPRVEDHSGISRWVAYLVWGVGNLLLAPAWLYLALTPGGRRYGLVLAVVFAVMGGLFVFFAGFFYCQRLQELGRTSRIRALRRTSRGGGNSGRPIGN